MVSLLVSVIMTIVAFQGGRGSLSRLFTASRWSTLILRHPDAGRGLSATLQASVPLFVHIGLALLSFATLIIAALLCYAARLDGSSAENKRLKFTPDMPPLMVIERKCFHITQVGVILLFTFHLTLATGIVFMDNIFDKDNIHKSLLSMVAGVSVYSCCCGGTIM